MWIRRIHTVRFCSCNKYTIEQADYWQAACTAGLFVDCTLAVSLLDREFVAAAKSHYVYSAKLGSFSCVFTEKQESELVVYILSIEESVCGIITKEIRKLAFDLTEY